MSINFENITPDLLHRYYQAYVIPNLIYCCQVWQGGDEVQLQPIENAVAKFWELSPTKKPPKSFIEPRLLFILFDLNYVKKMRDGISPLDFDEMFKTSTMKNPRDNVDEKIPAPTFRLEISRHKFGNRTRSYWNLLPKDIRHLKYNSFKREAKTYVLNNSERFLNLGNKNKARPKDLPEIVPYEPSKVEIKIAKISTTTVQTTIKNKSNSAALKRLDKKVKIDKISKPVTQKLRIQQVLPVTKTRHFKKQDGELPSP
jgi:hypothetical protein